MTVKISFFDNLGPKNFGDDVLLDPGKGSQVARYWFAGAGLGDIIHLTVE